MATKREVRIAVAILSVIALALCVGIYFRYRTPPAPVDHFDLSETEPKEVTVLPIAVPDLPNVPPIKPITEKTVSPAGASTTATGKEPPEGFELPEGAKFVRNIPLSNPPPAPVPATDETVYIDEAILAKEGLTEEDLIEETPGQIVVRPALSGDGDPQAGDMRVTKDGHEEFFEPDYGWLRDGDTNENGDTYWAGFGWVPWDGPNITNYSTLGEHAGDTTIIGY